MNRFLGFSLMLIALVALCCDCCSTITNSHSGRQLAAKEADETVALVIVENNHTHMYCSAVWASNKYLLTANHCVDGLARHINDTNTENATEDNLFPIVSPLGLNMQFVLPSEITEVGKNTSAIHNATAKFLYKSHDLALLEVVNPNSITHHGVIRVTSETPKQGDELTFMGHPDGFYFSFYTGNVAAIRSDLVSVPTMGPFIQVSGPITHGNSGGCAFDSDGFCVGIASFANADAPSMGFYISTETIRGVLIGAGILKARFDFSAPDPEL